MLKIICWVSIFSSFLIVCPSLFLILPVTLVPAMRADDDGAYMGGDCSVPEYADIQFESNDNWDNGETFDHLMYNGITFNSAL